MPSIRPLLDELSIFLQIGDLTERKAFSVGTISTYKDGSKWEKLNSGKWRQVSRNNTGRSTADTSPDEPVKSKRTQTKRTQTKRTQTIQTQIKKLKLGKHKSDKPVTKVARAAVAKKSSSEKPGNETTKPEWYNKKNPFESAKVAAATKEYLAKGFSSEEADYAASAMREWTLSSVSKGAAHLRGAMSAMVGRSLDDEKIALDAALKTYGSADEQDSPPDDGTELSKAFEGAPPPNKKTVKRTLTKLAKMSQKAYEEDTVTLYRGVSSSVYEDATNSGALKVGVLSSWSEDPKIAKSFSDKGGGVLRVEVPRKQIAMSYRACPSLLQGEKEVMLACKGAIEVKVWKGESRKSNYVTIKLEDGVELEVSDEPEKEAADGYNDWMHKFRNASDF